MKFKREWILLLSLVLIVLAGCGISNSDKNYSDRYINEAHGYQFIFPDSWIGKVEFVEYEIHTEFYHIDYVEEFGPIYHIITHTRDDWDQGKRNGGMVFLESDDYVITSNFTVWGSFWCEDKEIEDCEEKVQEIGGLLKEIDRDQHFSHTKIDNSTSASNPPSSESMYIHLDYPVHGMPIFPLDLPDQYPRQLAMENGDVINSGNVIHLERLIDFVENTSRQQPDQVRVVIYTAEGDPIIEELEYDGKDIYYTKDNTRDKFGRKLIINKTCSGIDYETTDTYDSGEPLHFGRSMAFYLMDCDGDEEKHIFQYIRLKELSNQYSSNLTEFSMSLSETVYDGNELSLTLENTGSSEVIFTEFYQLEIYTGYTWNQIPIPYDGVSMYGEMTLKPGELHSHTVHFRTLEEPLTSGRYRIFKHFAVVDEIREVHLAVEFEVK